METLATELIKELRASSKRWFIAFIVVLVLWFATIGIFVWYLNQPIEETETTYTQEADSEDSSTIRQVIGE